MCGTTVGWTKISIKILSFGAMAAPIWKLLSLTGMACTMFALLTVGCFRPFERLFEMRAKSSAREWESFFAMLQMSSYFLFAFISQNIIQPIEIERTCCFGFSCCVCVCDRFFIWTHHLVHAPTERQIHPHDLCAKAVNLFCCWKHSPIHFLHFERPFSVRHPKTFSRLMIV